MERHADFAMVVSLRQGFVNEALSTAFDERPFFFPLPQTISVPGLFGQIPVSFGGFARIAAPRIELHANPQDLIRTHFAFFSTFTARVGGQPAKRWEVRLDAVVDLHLVLAPENGVVVLWLDTSTITFQPLSVTFLQGPSPSPEVVDALESSVLAAAASVAVHNLPKQRIWNVGPDRLVHTQPASFKESGFSVFNWFTIILDINRVETRVFEDAVTIGVDFSGVTQGNRNALVDLTRAHGGGGVYIQRMMMQTSGSAPILEPRGYTAPSDVALTFNLVVLQSVLMYQVSPQIRGTAVRKNVVLYSIRGSYGEFEKPLRGYEDGLWFRLIVAAESVPAIVDIYLQPFLRTYNDWDGPYDLAGRDHWLMFVGRVDVDIPGDFEVMLGVAQAVALAVGVAVWLPAALLSPKGFFPLFTELMNGVFDAFNDADTSNAAAAIRLGVQDTVYDASLPQARYLSLSNVGPSGSLDMGFGSGSFVPFPAIDNSTVAVSSKGPSTWPASNRRPILTFVKLSPGWETLNRSNLLVTWEVRRKDTNAVVASGTKPYNAGKDNGVMILHHSEDLYLVSGYVVRYSITMTLGSVVGEITSGQYDLTIEDDIDRTFSFVEWGPKYVYFANAGTEGKTWSRISRSRIHRTAVAARCKGLRLAVSLRQLSISREQLTGQWVSKYSRFRYMKDLPFNWTALADHRTELCEYCFFGGPARLIAYPREDWFEPNGPAFTAIDLIGLDP